MRSKRRILAVVLGVVVLLIAGVILWVSQPLRQRQSSPPALGAAHGATAQSRDPRAADVNGQLSPAGLNAPLNDEGGEGLADRRGVSIVPEIPDFDLSAWSVPGPPYPEHIDELPPWHVTRAEIQRRIDAGERVTLSFGHVGPHYDDDGDLASITWYNHSATGTENRRGGTVTWGEARPDDLDEPPTVEALLEEFGMWMRRDVDIDSYEVGFLSQDGRFFRFRGVGGVWDFRERAAVPEGRESPTIGSLSVYRIMATTSVYYARLRGGYAAPGLRVAGLPVGENIFVMFQGDSRIAMSNPRIWQMFSQFPTWFFKMWKVKPEVVTITRPVE